MTCIVGLVHDGVTYIGADSLGSDGYTKTIRNDKKVFRLRGVKDAIIGFTTSFRMGQLLMHTDGLIETKDIFEDVIDHRYLVTKFIPKVIQLFENGGFSKNDNGEKHGGEFLLGYKNKLYKIASDFQVAETKLNYDACGSGEHFALGSLHSTEIIIDDPIVRIHKALKAASEFSCTVAPPFYILNTANFDVIELQ